MAKTRRAPTLKQLEKQQRELEALHAARTELSELFSAWLEEYKQDLTIPERTASRLQREIGRIEKEITTGKTANIAERFAEAVEIARTATLPRVRVTYLKTIDALQELVTLSREWYQGGQRSKQDQARMLRYTRRLLLEIEAGHIENLAQRFRQTLEDQRTNEEAAL